jgi:glycosyltransferase involved in cell wall biosynthesis
MRNILDYSWRVLRPSTTGALPRPDLVIGSSVHPLAGLAGLILARRFDVPFVFEVRDLWPQTLIEMGRIGRRSLLARLLRALERLLYRRAAKVVVLMPGARDYIQYSGVDPTKIVWISNGVDLETFDYRIPPDREPLSVVYFGAHGDANGLDYVLQAIARANIGRRPPALMFRFIGDGPRKGSLEALAGDLGLNDVVRFEPPVPKAQIPDIAAQADAFILNVRDLPLYRYGISMNKLFDYLAAGRPIIFAGPAEDNPVAAAGAGLCVPGDDVAGMAAAMESLAVMPYEARVSMGQRGRAYVAQHYSFEKLSARLCAELLPLLR